MRSSLSDLANVYNIETDCGDRICSFEADLDKVDIGVRLHELSFDNDKLKGWSLASMEAVATEDASLDGNEAEGAQETGAEADTEVSEDA